MKPTLFQLFGQALAAIKVNDFRAAACAAGKIIALVCESTPAELLESARPKLAATAGETDAEPVELEPVTPRELYEATAAFVYELEADHHTADRIVREGAASDPTIEPGDWPALFGMLMKLLRRYIHKPLDWKPAPLQFVEPEPPKPPEPAPALPVVAKPSDVKKADEPPANPKAEDESGDGHDADSDAEPHDDEKGGKPKGKKAKKP